jgi:bifunctional non-homologous end joining protein LigD
MPTTTLYCREGNSDKVYQTDIQPSGDGFIVSFAYGRRGATLQTGTKTSKPVSRDEARGEARRLKAVQGLHPDRRRHALPRHRRRGVR